MSVCYVDNYCHGLILGERALYPGSPALTNFTSAPTGEAAIVDPTPYEPYTL